jgi:hypothetical protein
VTAGDNGNLSGYAWAENIGWINFSGTARDGTLYKVSTGVELQFFSVGGTVSGLAGTGLQLQINLGEKVELTENGDFNFPTRLVKGSNYSVTVFSEPTDPGQTCGVSNANGTVSGGDVSDILVTCVDKPEEIFAAGFED